MNQKQLKLNETTNVHSQVIQLFKNQGYDFYSTEDNQKEKITIDSSLMERENLRNPILKRIFIKKIQEINNITQEEAEKVYKEIKEFQTRNLFLKSKEFYQILINGFKLKTKEGKIKIIKLIDFENSNNNHFLLYHEFIIQYLDHNQTRRPDFIVFINGIPIAIFELKNLNESIIKAFEDHKAKKEDIPQLYIYSQILVISNYWKTKVGSKTANYERFFDWLGINSDEDLEEKEANEILKYYYKGQEISSLEVLIRGLFHKERLLDYLQNFIIYDETNKAQIIAMSHQFYAANKAIKKTKDIIINKKRDRRIGTIWHTQGSGKSLTMFFYVNKLLKQKELNNPLVVMITDRQELDDQLSSVFEKFLKTTYRAESINHLSELLSLTQGGVIFTTIQKFQNIENFPKLSERDNIIVIADEAHRSQYRKLAQNLRKVLPNASFLGFTATPISQKDRDTVLVFGDYISKFTLDKALRHRIVVPIFYESRLPEFHLKEEDFIEAEKIFETVTDALDLNNSTDSFLFGTKRGYCVHFASSFATMARMVGIPSRVVTGYRGNRGNGLKSYLIIKERDAHAWVELLIDRHWVRYETTAFASKMDEDTRLLLNPQKSGEQSSINLYLMYIKYQIDTWVLNYSYIRQLQLLNKAQNNPWFIVKFIGSIILVILFSYILIARFRRPVCYDELLCIIAPLIDRLKESGYRREDRETMHQFLQRYIDENPNSRDIAEIDRLYEEIRYGGSSSQKRIKTLKEMVDSSKIEI